MTTVAPVSLAAAHGLHRAGNLAEAARLYAEILRTEPRNSNALYLLGFVHFQRGEFADAERLMGEALAINPNSLDALYNRGRALIKLKRPEEAIALFDRMLAMNPAIAEAHASRGRALLDLKRYEEALQSLDRALHFDRTMTDAWHNRGLALAALGRAAEALASYGSGLAVKPQPETLNNRADLLVGLHRLEEAAGDYEAILKADPKFPYARGSLAFYRLRNCDWRDLDAEREHISAAIREGARVAQPGMMLALSASAEDQLRCATLWVANELPLSSTPLWRGERHRHDQIRISYVSGDFNAHAVAFLIAGVLEGHDRDRFEVTAVGLSPGDGSAIRARILKACDRFVDGSACGDDELAAMLRRMEIDIAVDLMGHTGGNRSGLFARRVAPVQVSYLGFPGTTGAPYIDYLIADTTVVPPAERRAYSESVVYLPDAYLPAESPVERAARTPGRTEAGLPECGFVFVSFTGAHKIQPPMFDTWTRLLNAVPGSVLWLQQASPIAVRHLRREAERRGIAGDRVVFAPFVPSRGEHLARLSLADLFLDTLPYGGHATSLDALSAGVPVLTCLGTTFSGRVAASLLRAAGLPELVTRSLAEYEALALKLARDPAALSSLKLKLAANRDCCALFDTEGNTRNLEAAYIRMWQRAQRGEPPAAFAVERPS